MAWFDPRAVEHRRKMFTRHDGWRWAPPGSPEAKMPGYLHPSARIAAFEKAQQDAAEQEAVKREELQRGIDQVRRELDEVKRELAAKRAAWERADEAARIKCDSAWERFVQAYKRHVAQPKTGVDRKWDGQPHDELGRFDFGKKPKGVQLAGDITGFTKHGINQAISRGVSPTSLHDAVVNPIQILPQANGTTQYVGGGAVVVLNPLGQVVTTWQK